MSSGVPQQNPFAQLLAVAREVSFMKGADPLAGLERSRRASFDWIAFLPVLPFFDGFDAGEIDELAASGGVLELPRRAA